MKQYIEQLVSDLEKKQDQAERTKAVSQWLKNAPDDIKQKFAYTWTVPHAIFMVLSNLVDPHLVQDVNYSQIFHAKDLGTWSTNGNQVLINL